jgi:hypothetical protein
VSSATGARLAGFSLGSGRWNRDRAVKEDHGRGGHGGARRARARQSGRSRWQQPGNPRGSSANAIACSSCYRPAQRVSLLTAGRFWMIMAYVRAAASGPWLRCVR